MIVRDSRNRPVVLGRKIGGGGEGDVYAVSDHPRLAAKIYATPTREAGEKLARMIANPPSGQTGGDGHVNLAWPSELLYRAGDRDFPIGFLMPHVAGSVPLLEVFNPRLRARTLPDFDRRYLFRTARNLATVLATLHQAGYVVGDINESNILVGPSALVSFIDCDSFQVQTISAGKISTFPCPVGKLEYTAPELQGKVFGREVRLPEADRFALGVLIFQLLMEGRHPFAGTWTGSGEPPSVEEKIRRGCFPYADRPTCPIAPPANAPALTTLPPTVAALVRRCFVDGHRQPTRRPTSEVWRDALVAGESVVSSPAVDGRVLRRTTTPIGDGPAGKPTIREQAPAEQRRARLATRRVRGSGRTTARSAPRAKAAREVMVTFATLTAIVCAIGASSWWLLQRHALPFAGSAATTPFEPAQRPATETARSAGASAGGTNACTPATAAAAAAKAATVAPQSPYVTLDGSWVASATNLHIRFFGMPWWDDLPTVSQGTRYSVGTVPDGAGDRLDVIRVPGRGGPATATVWQAEFDAYTHRSSTGESSSLNPATVTSAAVTSRPRPQAVAGYDGYIGQFHFREGDATQIDATMWVGQVGCDRVVMVFAGLPTRDRQIDQAVAQVLGTIDFNAR
jgi:hypothetical protein